MVAGSDGEDSEGSPAFVTGYAPKEKGTRTYILAALVNVSYLLRDCV